MQTEPADVNTVTPVLGTNEYAQDITANISAQHFIDCPSVYVFDHWVGDVADANAERMQTLNLRIDIAKQCFVSICL
jgi:hypothetical protein